MQAGLLAFGFGKVLGGPQLDRASAADAEKAKADAAKGGPAVGAELVFGRVGQLSPRAVAVLPTAGAIIVVTIVPSLKDPANPPSLGEPETIGTRTAGYFFPVVVTAGAGVVRPSLVRRLWQLEGNAERCGRLPHGDGRGAAPGAGGQRSSGWISGSAAVATQMVSLGMQLIMWAVIGLLSGPLAESVIAAKRDLQLGCHAEAARRSWSDSGPKSISQDVFADFKVLM